MNKMTIGKEDFDVLLKALHKIDDHLDNKEIERARFIVDSLVNSVYNNMKICRGGIMRKKIKDIYKLIEGYEQDKKDIIERAKKNKTAYEKKQTEKELEVFYTLTDVIEDLNKILEG